MDPKDPKALAYGPDQPPSKADPGGISASGEFAFDPDRALAEIRAREALESPQAKEHGLGGGDSYYGAGQGLFEPPAPSQEDGEAVSWGQKASHLEAPSIIEPAPLTETQMPTPLAGALPSEPPEVPEAVLPSSESSPGEATEELPQEVRSGVEPDAGGAWSEVRAQAPIDPQHPQLETIDDPRIPPDQLFFKIGEVAQVVGVKPYVLRYWENEFSWIRPEKTSSRQRRYRREDVALLLQIRRLRYDQQLTVAQTRDLIRDARKRNTRPEVRSTLESAPPMALPEKIRSLGTQVAESDRALLARRLGEMRQLVLELLEAVEE